MIGERMLGVDPRQRRKEVEMRRTHTDDRSSKLAARQGRSRLTLKTGSSVELKICRFKEVLL